MKFKKIMLITLLLLAVLTIGAVSASDDVASDNVTASDDVDVIAEDVDPEGDVPKDDVNDDGYGAWYNESEIITDEDDEGYDEDVVVASMTVPNTTASGEFSIFTDDSLLFSVLVNQTQYWKDNGAGGLVCNVQLKDLPDL